MKIVDYTSRSNIIVEFQDNYKFRKRSTMQNFNRGGIKNPYDITVYGFGCVGVGKYEISDGVRFTPINQIWRNMIARCYYDKVKIKYPAYHNCEICEEWRNYQNFAQWYEDNYYVVDNETMEIDKDILHKGNKIYAPEYCVLVPSRINLLIVNKRKCRGKFPLGVSKSTGGKFIVQTVDECGNTIRIGKFLTIEEAFIKYKDIRESIIKKVANQYKSKIPENLYNALLDYKIEITD